MPADYRETSRNSKRTTPFVHDAPSGARRVAPLPKRVEIRTPFPEHQGADHGTIGAPAVQWLVREKEIEIFAHDPWSKAAMQHKTRVIPVAVAILFGAASTAWSESKPAISVGVSDETTSIDIFEDQSAMETAAMEVGELEGVSSAPYFDDRWGWALVEAKGELFVTVVEPATPCLLYTSPSPRDATLSRMPSSA